MKFVLVGAGGHAKAVVEALISCGASIIAYVDPRPAEWLDAQHFISDDQFNDREASVVIGVGGTTSKQLKRRAELANDWNARGFATPAVLHPTSIISSSARIDLGVQILAGTIVQPNAIIERAVIINTGAIIEHDASIGEGAHIAPGAVILGGATIGAAAMISANVVVLPGATVPDGTLVRTNTVWPNNVV